ncbi:glycosyltransferase [Prosthecomicrobium sp. N25]|uniref:glycosyltransferase n=1 Tax=Prosthecomicrobium sp. N25 TaxID=3129254 RepID=UPI00307817EF
MTRVSAVVTTYDHARFLGEAIDSILAQTRPADEIIVVDDGSADDPAAVVARYGAPVRLIRQANAGLSAARNTGLAAATGDMILFLDADDRLRPEMIARTLEALAACPDCAFAYGAYAFVDEAGNDLGTVRLKPPGDDAYADFVSGNIVGMHGTVLYRRAAVLAAGGFDPSLRACEDYDLYLRLARSHPVRAVDAVLADYRRHGTNMSLGIPRMLDAALTVVGRHREPPPGRTGWAERHAASIAAWKAFYAAQQLGQLAGALKRRKGVAAQLAASARIARIAPGQVLRDLRRRAGGLRRKLRRRLPGARIRFGDLARTTPVSTAFGYDRGKPLDRRYIEAFLAAHAADIRGRVLEIGDAAYSTRFGGPAVTRQDVLNRHPGHPATTFVGDLADGAGLPADAFDCIVLTQTLHLVFDMPAAVATLHRSLKPGGVLLATVPWASPIDRGEWGAEWYWSVSPAALRRLLSGPFAPERTEVVPYGNVMAAAAFLYGLAEHELRPDQLDVHDPHCPVVVAGRAVKTEVSR